ncbi:MAG: YggS family pyridoxal phosphate-dependent enzyme [Flavobacteriales bacterium]|nr:YggS family pyridoxal phosphate-dependent enzyme [Flavobacteriales bacterium]
MIKENIDSIKKELRNCKLVAVSKFRSFAELTELYKTGQRIFAENRVQELLKKKAELPQDISWHLIGHLQTNKVKSIVGKVDLVHSVDSLKLLEEINRQSEINGIKTNILLQIHIAQEETKFGFAPEELRIIIQSHQLSLYNYVNILGLMTMATNTNSIEQITQEFKTLKSLFDEIKPQMPNNEIFNELSMGMSSDYKIAIEQGSTMVRIGSKIFE